MTDPVFVFGSNLAGCHGKGAALWAKRHRGPIYAQLDLSQRQRPQVLVLRRDGVGVALVTFGLAAP
jgi:hypothetical protein